MTSNDPSADVMKKNCFAVQYETTEMESGSPCLVSARKPGKSQQRHLRGLAIAAAILIVPIFALHKAPAEAGAPEHKSGDGTTGLWEKNAGPPGLTVNVIYKTNNIVMQERIRWEYSNQAMTG